MPKKPLEVPSDGEGLGRLFVEQLGWRRPTITRPLTVAIDGETYKARQIAEFTGLGVWHCPAVPSVRHQRAVDRAVTQKNTERLIIFGDGAKQEWRWPRYTGHRAAANPRLVSHTHILGEPDSPLEEKLALITIDPRKPITVPELLVRMREAFNEESERASVAAARRMGTLYGHLERARVEEDSANRLLARLLFLMFGDDTEMWQPNLFHDLVSDHTKTDGSDLREFLGEVFLAADTPENSRPGTTREAVRPIPYINGGLFSGAIQLPKLNSEIRGALLDACRFDWGQISPAVFGAMFQTVKSKEARRSGGEHYTTEENILKTIGPLFLDELWERLESAWDDKGQLTRLHNHLKDLRFIDPACGCGNFLIVAFRELRALELETLKRRRDLDQMDGQWKRSQLSLDAEAELHVRLEHFYGIEIESWPARIAETAMFLVNHQANQRMEQELGVTLPMLPLSTAAKIHVGNALRTEWASVVPPSNTVYIFGNPPFNGARNMPRWGRPDMEHVWKDGLNPNFDYVTAWYKKSLDYFGRECNARWGFVSTNSICQGEPVADLWQPILDAGWRCRFAHRSFAWDSEAEGKAAVHVSIVGYDRAVKSPPQPQLWTYPPGGKGEAERHVVSNINPYLAAGENILVKKRSRALCSFMPLPAMGHRAIDSGHLIVEPADYDSVAADAIAAKYVRRFVGAKELLHDLPRWCLWLEDASLADLRSSTVLLRRTNAVREERLKSRNPATREAAAYPHLFGIRAAPQSKGGTGFLCIPSVVSEHRRYFTAAYFGPEVICSNLVFTVSDQDGLVLGILSSAMFMAWQKAIGGRLKSDIRFSSTFTYNTFPLPEPDAATRTEICAAAQSIIAAREAHPGRSLAQLYNPRAMPADLLAAHRAVDTAVDGLFGVTADPTPETRQGVLFRKYQEFTAAPGATQRGNRRTREPSASESLAL